MLLIATDEAGYGPKLGPLVIVATAWKIAGDPPGIDQLTERFASLRTPQACGRSTVVVDDSKAVYKSTGGLDSLHAAVSTSLRWCGRDESTLAEILPWMSPDDVAAVSDTPWLDLADEPRFLNRDATRELLDRWQEAKVELVDVKARITTAQAFNAACAQGGNKADLLSQLTLGLVHSLVDSHGREQPNMTVYCDRHGGRRYYASVLQHVFPDARMQVMSETKRCSRYQLQTSESRIDVAFTVKGDTFTPVALSSMHAKYLRERFMQSFNAYFAARHRGSRTLKPTAGYPVDADRFLVDIDSILRHEQIDAERLIRSR